MVVAVAEAHSAQCLLATEVEQDPRAEHLPPCHTPGAHGVARLISILAGGFVAPLGGGIAAHNGNLQRVQVHGGRLWGRERRRFGGHHLPRQGGARTAGGPHRRHGRLSWGVELDVCSPIRPLPVVRSQNKQKHVVCIMCAI